MAVCHKVRRFTSFTSPNSGMNEYLARDSERSCHLVNESANRLLHGVLPSDDPGMQRSARGSF